MKLLPEEPTPEMVKAWCANCHAWDLDAYKAMWKAALEVEQEPVAYECFLIDECRHELTSRYAEAIKITDDEDLIVPLYTHQQPKREPLSGDNLASLLSQLQQCKTLMDIIRAIEKAHGIGVE